ALGEARSTSLSPRRRPGPKLLSHPNSPWIPVAACPGGGRGRDDAATSGFALRSARAHRLSRHLSNSKASCESVCTCTPVPADCTSPLTMCRRLPTTAPARPCRDTGIEGSTDQLLLTGSYASSERKVYIICAF